MRKYIWLIITLSFFLALVPLGFYAYRNIGIIEYNEIASQISKMEDAEEKKKSEDLFVGGGIEGVLYTGVVSFVNKYGDGGVLVYRNGSFKYFDGYKDTAYSYQTVCKGDPVLTVKLGGIPKINKIVTDDVKEWSKYVKPGDYVQILEADKRDKGVSGNLKEAWASDFVPFLNQEFSTICNKK